MWAVAVVVAVVAVGGLVWWTLRPQPPAPLAAYTIIAPKSVAESQLVARALVPVGTPCPAVKAAGRIGAVQLPMTPRLPGPNATPAFNTVTACSAALPVGISAATIGGTTIPAMIPATIETVGILADSGCRVDDKRIQDCNDANAWPLAQMAKRMAQARPDVILDPGDYYYREMACPADAAAECSPGPAPTPGMPFDENDQGWLYETFRPMAPMLASAPIAFLRGNHEDCSRAGNGYFLYLDPRDGVETTCEPVATDSGLKAAAPQTTPTWAFDLNIKTGRTLRVAMVDSAYGTDIAVTPWVQKQRVSYEEAAALTKPQAGVESWLMTHRPIFSLISDKNLPADDPYAESWSSDGQMVASYGLIGNYQMLLSSHNHFAQSVQIPGQAGSLVMGNGGALLDPTEGYNVPTFGPMTRADGSPLVPGLTPYPPPSSVWTAVQYGYAIATPSATAGAWEFDQRAYDGSQMATCGLASRTLSCTSTKS